MKKIQAVFGETKQKCGRDLLLNQSLYKNALNLKTCYFALSRCVYSAKGNPFLTQENVLCDSKP